MLIFQISKQQYLNEKSKVQISEMQTDFQKRINRLKLKNALQKLNHTIKVLKMFQQYKAIPRYAKLKKVW